MIFIGIDNGLSGAIAVISKDGKRYSVKDIPVTEQNVLRKNRKWEAGSSENKMKEGTKNIYDIKGLSDLFKRIYMLPDSEDGQGIQAILEYSHPMPDQGVTSTFSTGFGFGLMQGMLTFMNIPFKIVRAVEWQKEFSVSKEFAMEDSTKKLSFKVAHEIFPKAELSTARGRILDGRCDALLMAEWGRRKCDQTGA